MNLLYQKSMCHDSATRLEILRRSYISFFSNLNAVLTCRLKKGQKLRIYTEITVRAVIFINEILNFVII